MCIQFGDAKIGWLVGDARREHFVHPPSPPSPWDASKQILEIELDTNNETRWTEKVSPTN